MPSEILNYVVIIFIVMSVGMTVWVSFERGTFTHFFGPMKRGVKVGTEPLAMETFQFLNGLLESVRLETRFIRKEGDEVLIAMDRIGLRPRWNNWALVAYTDLRNPQRRLEFRMQLSTVVSLLFFFPLAMVIVFGLFGLFYDIDPIRFLAVFAAFLLLVIGLTTGSFWINTRRERALLLGILKEAMGET